MHWWPPCCAYKPDVVIAISSLFGLSCKAISPH
jgi:hypothetical protein